MTCHWECTDNTRPEYDTTRTHVSANGVFDTNKDGFINPLADQGKPNTTPSLLSVLTEADIKSPQIKLSQLLELRRHLSLLSHQLQ